MLPTWMYLPQCSGQRSPRSVSDTRHGVHWGHRDYCNKSSIIAMSGDSSMHNCATGPGHVQYCCSHNATLVWASNARQLGVYTHARMLISLVIIISSLGCMLNAAHLTLIDTHVFGLCSITLLRWLVKFAAVLCLLYLQSRQFSV